MKNNIKFIYSYFNKFLLIIKNNYLFIIINNKEKYMTKWIIKKNKLISEDNYNNLNEEHLKLLLNGNNNINNIKIKSKKYLYSDDSIFGKSLQILFDMKVFKNNYVNDKLRQLPLQ